MATALLPTPPSHSPTLFTMPSVQLSSLFHCSPCRTISSQQLSHQHHCGSVPLLHNLTTTSCTVLTFSPFSQCSSANFCTALLPAVPLPRSYPLSTGEVSYLLAQLPHFLSASLSHSFYITVHHLRALLGSFLLRVKVAELVGIEILWGTVATEVGTICSKAYT